MLIPLERPTVLKKWAVWLRICLKGNHHHHTITITPQTDPYTPMDFLLNNVFIHYDD